MVSVYQSIWNMYILSSIHIDRQLPPEISVEQEGKAMYCNSIISCD